MTERDFVAEAKSEGWRPKDEWKGDPDKWVEAETFVERGEKISGILKSKVDRLEQRLNKAEKANQQFGEYHKKTIEKERKEYERRITHLESLRSEAIDNGDGQTFTKIDREIGSIKQNMPSPPEEPYSMDPIEAQWLTSNQWYNSDQNMRAYADGVSDVVASEGYQGQARLDEITRRTKETFPDKFGNPNRDREGNTGGGAPVDEAPAKKASYKNLDKEGKEACDDFVSQGFMTQDEYVKQYFSEEE